MFFAIILSSVKIYPMCDFRFKTAIPTASDSRGLISRNGVYFSSNTHLFKLINSKYGLVSSCDGTIRSFGVCGDYSILCTQDRIFLNHFQNFVGSLNRSASAIDVSADFFAIGVDNVLEIWMIPKEYKPTLFRLHSKNVGHYRSIRFIKILNDTQIVTASDDCTVRMFDISRKESRIIASLNDVPAGLHVGDGTVIVACKNGSVSSVNVKSMEYRNMKFDANITASASFENILAVCFENMAAKKDSVQDPILPTISHPEKQAVSEKTVVIIFKDFEEIYRGEVGDKVVELALEKNTLYMRTHGFIGSYDIHSESFVFVLDLPKILNIALFKNMIAAGCADKKIRIYREASCTKTLHDPNSKGDVLFTHLSASICTAVYSTGHVSSFNINDSHCFRSFLVSNEPLHALSSSCVSDDGCFLFISEQANIKVVDLVRSKLVESINLKSPIISTAFYRNFLYCIELDKTLSKINVFSGHIENVMIENIPTSLVVKDQNVVVSTVKDVLIYDLDINFINSFSAQLEARKRNEMYARPKPVEQIDFNSEFIFCGGSSNLIKLFEHSFQQHTQNSLMKHFLFQVLRVSRNKDWENYKTKLLKEKDTKFDKERVIETRKICVRGDVMYLLSSEGLSVYEKNSVKLSPLEFDVVASKEYVQESLKNKSYQKALISAVQLGEFGLVRGVIDACDDKDFLVRYIPSRYAKVLLENLVGYIKRDFTNIEYIGLISKLILWHNISYPGLSGLIRDGTKTMYSEIKSNKYLIDVIFRRNI